MSGRTWAGWLQSPIAICLGMAIGALLGIFVKPAAEFVTVIGDLFLGFLSMCAIPIMVGALVSSLAKFVSTDSAPFSMTRLAVVMLGGLVIVGAVGLVGSLLGQPGGGIDIAERRVFGEALVEHAFAEASVADAGERPSILGGLLPANPFAALVEGNTMQLLFVTILCGILTGLAPAHLRDPVVNLAEAAFRIFQDAVGWALYFLPFGLMGVMANVMLTSGFDLLGATVKLIVYVYVICIVIMAVVMWIVAAMKKIPVSKQLSALREPLFLAFGSRDSIASMPTLMNALTRRLGFEAEAVQLAVPLGTLICRNSLTIVWVVSLVFAAQLYMIPLSLRDCLVILFGSVLGALANAGVPSLATMASAAVVAQSVGVPFSTVLLIMTGVLPVLDPVVTMMNVHVIGSLTMVISRQRDEAVGVERVKASGGPAVQGVSFQ